MKKKIISILLATLLLMLMLPIEVFAADKTVSQLYVGRAYSNDSLDVINDATGYSYDKSLLPAGLSLKGSYKYQSYVNADVFTLAMEGTPTKEGTYNFTVTYKKSDGTVSAKRSYSVIVGQNAPFSYVNPTTVSLVKWPNKYKGYYLGETIDFTGLKVTATVYKLKSGNSYEEIPNFDITNCCYTDKTILTSDEAQSVTVYVNLPTSNGETVNNTPQKIEAGSFRIEEFKYAGPNDVTSIKIKTNPEKMEYTVGEKFDPTGMVLEATMGNGSTKDIDSDYSFDINEFTEEGEITETITYKDFTTTLTVTVATAEEEPVAPVTTAPVTTPEPVTEPEPAIEPETEPEPATEPEPETEPEPVVEPEIEPEPIVEPEPETEPEKKSSIPGFVWIILALLVVIIAAVVALFFIGKKKIEDQE